MTEVVPATRNPRELVLLTGSNGVIGQVLARDLRADRAVRGFGRHVHEGHSLDDFVLGDLEDEQALARAMRGVTSVIHLAGNGDPEADWDGVLGSNIIGTRNVLEVARKAGVRRVVFASSNHVSGIDTIEGRRATAVRPPAAADLYGASKAFGEILGHLYAHRGGPSVICLRIGWIGPDDDRSVLPPDVDVVTEGMWISHRDICQIVRLAMASELEFGVFYAMSSGARGRWDIEDAEQRLGYRPQD